MTYTETHADRAARYGVQESNNIADFEATTYSRDTVDYGTKVYLDDPRLVSVDRVRYISSPGFPFWDFSYAYATIVVQNDKGEDCLQHVLLDLDLFQVPKRTFWTALKRAATDAGLTLTQARNLGLLSNDVVSLCQ